MAEKLRLRTNANGDIYFYAEHATGASVAFGSDITNSTFAINASATSDVEPDATTASVLIGPGANADLVLRPHGTGKTEVNTGNLQISAGNLTLPATASGLTEGALSIDGTVRMHAYGTQNLFLGDNVGNTTLNTGSAQQNFALGVNSLSNLTTGAGNDCVGWNAGTSVTTGIRNDFVGFQAGTAVTSGSQNIMIGYHAGLQLTTGSNNTIIGAAAGSNYTGAESHNILIDNTGTVGENNTIRIGTAGTQTKAYLAGTYGVTPAGSNRQVMVMTSDGQIGSSANEGAMVLIQSQEASTSASLIFKDNITSAYGPYFVSISNLVYDSGANPTLRVEYSNDNGATWIAASYNAAYLSNSWNSATITNTNSTTICPLAVSAAGAGNQISGWLWFQGLATSGKTSHEGRFFGQNVHFQAYGWNSANTGINALRFTYSPGNMTSGRISLYGLRK